jgi:type IV pilus assembly protein PilM
MMGNAAGKNVVGLDIEPGYVVAAQARPGAAHVIERAATVPLAPGVVREGEVADVETLAAALRELFADKKLGRRVRVGVANQRIVMRVIDLPPMEPKDIASAVRFQAQEHIPMPLEQAVLDHQSLGIVETADGPRTRVVLVAARRDMIDSVLGAVRRAGLRAEGIDLASFAMIRALHQPGRAGATLYMNVGGVTNVAVASGTTCLFTRVIPYGTETMAGELAERRGLTLEHAHGWLKHVGLTTPAEELDGDPEIVLEARTVATEGLHRIADEVRNSLDFHRMQHADVDVQQAVLTGPVAAVPGAAEHLGLEIGLPVELGTVREARPGALAGIEPGRAAVAAGLSVAEVAA